MNTIITWLETPAAERLGWVLVHSLWQLALLAGIYLLVRRLLWRAPAATRYHPALWWISREIRREREHCCDDLAVRVCGDRVAYARTLAMLEERRAPLPAAAMAATGGSLLQRIRRIVGQPAAARTTRGTWLAGALVILTVCVILPLSIATTYAVGKAAKPEFTKAAVEILIDAQGQPLAGKPVAVTLTDAAEVAELAAFFPRVGTGRKSGRAAGWEVGVTITFLTVSGEAVKVSVSWNDNLTDWSEGKGDWPVKGDFKAYVDKLRMRATPPTAKDFAATVAADFAEILRGQNLPWLDDAKLTTLRDTIERFVTQHQPVDMSDALRNSLLPAIKECVRKRFPTPSDDAFARETGYCAFPDQVKTFQWELWQAMLRKPIEPASAASLEAQRNWLREHVRSLPEALPAGTHAAALARLEALFSDPFCPLFQQPMSDAQFEQVKKGLGEYRVKEEIRYVSSHVLWKALDAQYPNAGALILPFDDQVYSYGAGGGRIDLSFKSNAALKGRQLAFHDGVYLDVSGPIIRSGGELPLLAPSLRGDVILDAEKQALTPVRGATLIPLRGRDWLEIDAIPDKALLTPSEWKESPSFALETLKEIGVFELSKFPGRFLAVRTAEGHLSVIEVRSVDGKSVDLHIRPRIASQPAAFPPPKDGAPPLEKSPTLQPAVYFYVKSGQGLDLDHAKAVDQGNPDVDAVLQGFQLLGRGISAACVKLPYEIENRHLTAEDVLAKATRFDENVTAWPLRNDKGSLVEIVFRTRSGTVGAIAVVGYVQAKNGDVLNYRVKCRLLPEDESRPIKAASFESFSVELITTAMWLRTINIRGDGKYTFDQKLRGAKEDKTLPQRQAGKSRLSETDLKKLVGLLERTEWLATPGRVQPNLEDGTKYAMSVVHDGRQNTTVCYGEDQDTNYAGLIEMLDGIAREAAEVHKRSLTEWGPPNRGLRVQVQLDMRVPADSKTPGLTYNLKNEGADRWSLLSARLVPTADSSAKPFAENPLAANVSLGPNAEVKGQSLALDQAWPDWRTSIGKHRIYLRCEFTGTMVGDPLLVCSVPLDIEVLTCRDAPLVAPPSSQLEEPLKAVLSSGVEIELVAVSDYPDKNAPWWRPDGTQLDAPPIDPVDLDITSYVDPKMRKIELVFRLSGKANQPAYESQIRATDDRGVWWAGRRTRDGKRADDMKVVGTMVPADAKTLEIDLLVAAGPWETVATSDGRKTEGPLGAAAAGDPAAGSGPSTAIAARFAPDKLDAQVIALDVDGVKHVVRGFDIRRGVNDAGANFRFQGLTPGQFKSFTLQTRPNNERIRLMEISLVPGQQTDAKLVAERIPGEPDAPAQPGALSFGPVIERVIPRPPVGTLEGCWVFNLASGKVVPSTPAKPLDFRADGTDTLRAAGVDLYQHPFGSSPDAVNALDLRLVSRDADAWNLPAVETMALLEKNANFGVGQSVRMLDGSHVYVFSTRDGTRGVLQITGADSPTTKLRYKLVQAAGDPSSQSIAQCS
jgi:hypothetical protein